MSDALDSSPHKWLFDFDFQRRMTVMQITFRRLAWGLAGAAALLATGCERADPRLENLSTGISKDSVISAMEGDQPKRIDPYLIDGLYIEAMLYPKKGKTDSVSLTDRKMSPVVVINGKLAGWGWPFWDSVASSKNIPVAPKGK